jgi:hypothetical protein
MAFDPTAAELLRYSAVSKFSLLGLVTGFGIGFGKVVGDIGAEGALLTLPPPPPPQAPSKKARMLIPVTFARPDMAASNKSSPSD